MKEEKTIGQQLCKQLGKQIEEICSEICDKYCKYPAIYDEETTGETMIDAVCSKCPLGRL